jgi:3-oxoacyl-[acyl-carrier-protein] synthase-1
VFDKTSPEVAKQTGSVPPAASTAAAPTEIVITAESVVTTAGDYSLALFGAVGAAISTAVPSKHLEVRALDGSGAVPVYTAAIDGLKGADPKERMAILLSSALSSLLAQVPEAPGEKILLHCCVPGPKTARGEDIDPTQWKTQLTDLDPRFVALDIRFVPALGNQAEALAQLTRDLSEGKWDKVIFGGVDSLVDVHTCRALAGRVLVPDAPDGLIPGEAAAFVLLERNAPQRSAPLAHLRAVAHAKEPQSGKADSQTTQGLIQAARAALAQARLSTADIDVAITALGQEQEGHFEWYQLTRALWPHQISEQQRVAVQLGEIDEPTIPDDPVPETLRPYFALGEIGAATFPLQLVLACARFEFEHPAAQHALVCETSDEPVRGAVVLTTAAAMKADQPKPHAVQPKAAAA